jgi:hypothetical protein
MARHIPTVALLLMIQGALDLVLGLALSGLALSLALGQAAPLILPAEPTAAVIVFGPAFLAAGALKIAAGLANSSYRRPRLGALALASCVVSMASGLCAPPSLALLVYGFVVSRHPQSERAFVLGKQGLSREWIKASLHRP